MRSPVVPVYAPSILVKHFDSSATCATKPVAFFSFAFGQCFEILDVCTKVSASNPFLANVCSNFPSSMVSAEFICTDAGKPQFVPFSKAGCTGKLSYNPQLSNLCQDDIRNNGESYAISCQQTLVMNINQIVNGVSASDFYLPSSELSFEQAVAAVTPGVKTSNVTITSAEPLSLSLAPAVPLALAHPQERLAPMIRPTAVRLVSPAVAAATPPLGVNYTVAVDWWRLGYPSMGAAYTTLSSALTASVFNGQFTKALEAAATSNGAIQLVAATSTYVQVRETSAQQFVPGPAPSPAPGPVDASTSASASSNGALVGGLVGTLLALLVVAGIVYYFFYYKKRPKSELENSMIIEGSYHAPPADKSPIF